MPHVVLEDDARKALDDAIRFSFDDQKEDGHWAAEVSADVTFTSEYVMFKCAMGLDLEADRDDLKKWLLQDQKDDGSWALSPDLPGNNSTTTEAYLALKILGVPRTHPQMLKTQNFMKSHGGVEKVRFFTRFFLSTFGLFPYSAIPQLPAELILMPSSSPLNIYTFSSWARSTLIPILIVRHHEPIYALPNGRSDDNDYLDEIWCNPANKNIPYAPPLSKMFWGAECVEFGFTAIDKLLGQMTFLKHSPLRDLSRRKCVEWLLKHQEKGGDWAGFFPPMHGSLWALILEGFPLDHKAVLLGLEAMERLTVSDDRGKRVPPTVSPVWDTALMMNALCDAGLASDPRVSKAVSWVKDRQLLNDHGDWRVYSENQIPGGWSFEYNNTLYPDVDDTAVVVMSLLKYDPYCISSSSVLNATEWMLGMQNPDGGWGAFDTKNDKLWLHKIPFSDMDSLCDPSSADITGRLLECFGMLLNHHKGSLNNALRQRLVASSGRGIMWLEKDQHPCGGWWGRWGNNFTYGTGNVMRGLVYFSASSLKVREMVRKATRWFESCQNPDGGWGEHLRSYNEPEWIGKGPSTSAQTAWALLSLQPYRPQSDPYLEKGIRWLISNQNVRSKTGSSWPTNVYTATGFPNVLYLGYPYYHHFFSIMALKKYLDGKEQPSYRSIELSNPISRSINQPNILLMVIGSRGDIQVFLNIAKALTKSHGYRVRVATHSCHQNFVESNGIEFYATGGDPSAFAKAFTENPNILYSAVKGEYQILYRSFTLMLQRFWKASIDNEYLQSSEKLPARPFIADGIVSSLSSLTHVHCAEKLQVPLVLASLQPLLTTSEFPNVLTMSKPKFSAGRKFNSYSYFILDLINWLVFGSYLQNLRVNTYGMATVSWTWATYDFWKMSIPHVCLWSPHILPKPVEWDSSTIMAGYSFTEDLEFTPPTDLERFLLVKSPIMLFSFGSASLANPQRLLSMIFEATAKLGYNAVICQSSSDIDNSLFIPDHVYITEEIPHSWILPRVNGFIHHGGAGHTAVGVKNGVPQLIMPFYLDQNFWAVKIKQLRLGPPPLDRRILTTERLQSSLEDLLSKKYKASCDNMASRVSEEKDGACVAAETISRVQRCTETAAGCSIIPSLRAQWKHTASGITLSGAAAACLVSEEVIYWSDLEIKRAYNWSDQQAVTQPALLRLMGKVIALICVLLSAILQILRFSTHLGFDKLRTETIADEFCDPVRQAKMDQGVHDLKYIKEEMREQVDITRRVVENWSILHTEAFHRKIGLHLQTSIGKQVGR
ncbi:related to squalene cyclase [Rhynchosporium secalis]|uniref:Related to squalene cyclase n=1 Tax=Rhynchosporium secalis TaxID=38038 RepID=A0A1E1MT64_RHYSE|nr:related to squalene cyclase [Rhynchosporium secalis]